MLSGFDYEVSARVEHHRRVHEPGTVLVSGRLLADITRSLPAGRSTSRTDGARSSLTCGIARFTLLTLPVEDYPTLPEMPERVRHGRAATLFAAAVGQAVDRRRSRRHAAGAHRRPDRDRGRRRSPCWPPTATGWPCASCAWSPEQTDLGAARWCPPESLADTAKSLTSAATVTIALASAAAPARG